MAGDKFSAIWVSHTSITDFLQCPRAYYLKHIYRNPNTGHKIKLMSPPLALGQAVHEVIEALSILPVKERFKESLVVKFGQVWQKVNGDKGGFSDIDTEMKYKNRGEAMLKRVMDNPGPIAQPAVKIKMNLPYFWLSEEHNIILCGKIDWLEYLADTDSVHVIDFKTSKHDEDPKSLQLSIYHLLVHHCQKRHVAKASYWYLERSDKMVEKKLPDIKDAQEQIMDVARQIKLARQLGRFRCSHENGCHACRSLEKIVQGKAQLVGVDDYRTDIFILKRPSEQQDEEDSVIL